MDDRHDVVLSVRGESQRAVAPDHAVLQATITAVRDSKAEALRAAADTADAVVAAMAALGGVALTGDTERHPLTWSAQSASTYEEHDFNKMTGEHGPTGRVIANVTIAIGVRNFALLTDVDQLLAAQRELHVHYVAWLVDADNPAWPQVRAAAIHAALAKGRDYASALGGSVVRVEQVADVGLLGGDAPIHHRMSHGYAMASSASAMDVGPGVPSLDPAPQELLATIDARLVASVPGEMAPG